MYKKILYAILAFFVTTACFAQEQEVPVQERLEMLKLRLWDNISSTDPDSVTEFTALVREIDRLETIIAQHEEVLAEGMEIRVVKQVSPTEKVEETLTDETIVEETVADVKETPSEEVANSEPEVAVVKPSAPDKEVVSVATPKEGVEVIFEKPKELPLPVEAKVAETTPEPVVEEEVVEAAPEPVQEEVAVETVPEPVEERVVKQEPIKFPENETKEPTVIDELADTMETTPVPEEVLVKEEVTPPEELEEKVVKVEENPQTVEELLTQRKYTEILDGEGRKRVVVNRKNFHMDVYKGDTVVNKQRVVIGTPDRETPAFTSVITHVVLNPFWNVSPTIAAEDLAPVFLKDPDSAIDEGFEILESWQEDAKRLNPANIDWARMIERKRVPYLVRQQPGPKNRLGQVKFIVKTQGPETQGILLHGSSLKERDLFSKTERKFSSGCVRVEDEVSLAKILLNGDSGLTRVQIFDMMQTGKTRWLRLKKPVDLTIL